MKEIEKILRAEFNNPKAWGNSTQFGMRKAFQSRKYFSNIREAILKMGEVPVLRIVIIYHDPEFGMQWQSLHVNLPHTASVWQKKYLKLIIDELEKTIRSGGDYEVSFRICRRLEF